MRKDAWISHIARHLLPVLSLFWMAFAARAELQFTQPTADLGVVHTGPKLLHRFEFVNAGAEPVQIADVKASCGCLRPRVSKLSFQPGEAGCLELDINTLSQPAGPNNWRVQLTCRSESQVTETTLQLTAQLVTEVTVEPAALMIDTHQVIRHQIHVRDQRSKPFMITSVQASSLHMTVKKVSEKVPDTFFSLEVEQDYPEGRHEEVISIFTDDPAYREMQVPVTIVKRERERVSATPGQVSLEAEAGKPVPSRIVLLRDADNQSVKIERITADDPAIVCQWAAGPNSMATLKVRIDHNLLQGRELRSAVHIEVSEPAPQTLIIPVECRMRNTGP